MFFLTINFVIVQLMKPKYFDIHSHLNFSTFNSDREEVVKRMCDKSVWTISVGTDLETSKEVVELANKYDNIFATVGLHPDSHKGLTFVEDDYRELVRNKKVVAVGECGLDYFRIGSDESDKKRQKENFERQIQFAIDNDLPLMLHFRPSGGAMDAYIDGIEILNSYTDILRGNSHFFAGDLETAKRFLNIGFTLSFTGVITFAKSYDEIIKYAPLDMIMSETDAPFVAPVPHRGKRSEPVYVKEVVKHIAKIRKEDTEKVRKTLLNNAFKLFSINSTVLS